MKQLLAGILVLFLLLPVAQSFAQVTNTPSTLGVKLTSTQPFIFKNDEGYTVVIGEVENTRSFAVNNVKIWVGFYSSTTTAPGGQPPLETVTGTSLLDVIPPNSKSPFIVMSSTPNSNISEVNINVLGFNSVSSKQQLLEISAPSASVGNTVKVTAEITNKGQQDSIDTNVHLIAYDAFNPPRIVGIETATVDRITKGSSEQITFDAKMDYRATSFKLVAESDNYQSKITEIPKVTLDSITKLITIGNVRITESGNQTSEVRVGTPVQISSDLSIQFGAKTNQQQGYVYYAQVKQFGDKAPVEFLGFYEGVFDSAQPQTATVTWVPENEGAFFVEAYVWDMDGVALAAPSKTISIILVKP